MTDISTDKQSDITDVSTDKQSDISEEHSKANSESVQEGRDIVRRTTLSLPSLTGLEQAPPSSDWQQINSVPTVSIWEEVPLPASSPPTLERRLSLPGVPGLPVSSANSEKLILRSSLPATPAPQQKVFLRTPPPATEQKDQAVESGPSLTDGRISSLSTAPFKKVRLRSFKIVTLLTILLLAACVYIYTRTIPTATGAISANKPVSIASHKMTPTPTSQGNKASSPIFQGSKSFQVGTYAFVGIKGGNGDVNIHAGSAGTVMVKLRNIEDNQGKNADATSTQYSQLRDALGHDQIDIKPVLPGGDANYDVTVPNTAQLDVEVGSGSISVDGISGITITTGSGSIDIENVNGPVNASTQSGDVILKNVKGQMIAGTVNGSVKVDGMTGQLTAVTQNGNVTVKQAALSGQSVLKTDYGSVDFAGAIDPNGTYTMETKSGNVNLALPYNAAFQLHASTNSGSIHNGFGSNSVGSTPQAQIDVNIGSGSVTVKNAG